MLLFLQQDPEDPEDQVYHSSRWDRLDRQLLSHRGNPVWDGNIARIINERQVLLTVKMKDISPLSTATIRFVAPLMDQPFPE